MKIVSIAVWRVRCINNGSFLLQALFAGFNRRVACEMHHSWYEDIDGNEVSIAVWRVRCILLTVDW